jgi:hypothetical protein
MADIAPVNSVSDNIYIPTAYISTHLTRSRRIAMHARPLKRPKKFIGTRLQKNIAVQQPTSRVRQRLPATARRQEYCAYSKLSMKDSPGSSSRKTPLN